MVFPPVPVCLDPPNWHPQQQLNHQQGAQLVNNENPPQLPPLPPLQPHGGGGGSVRPGSMADRARLAKIPQPEAGLKCPRCDSTNTKFCYFNNYSLTQPRHFCKTCRRYWTRGGALRSVPVGGGCRRNKKSKNPSQNNSKFSTSSSTNTSSLPSLDYNINKNNMIAPNLSTQLPFMASMHGINQFGGGSNGIGLNFSGIQGLIEGASSSTISNQGEQQAAYFEPSLAELYPFQGVETEGAQPSPMGADASTPTTASRVSQFSSVKMENSRNQQGFNLASRQSLGTNSEANIVQFWGGNNNWNLNNSSSTSHLL